MSSPNGGPGRLRDGGFAVGRPVGNAVGGGKLEIWAASSNAAAALAKARGALWKIGGTLSKIESRADEILAALPAIDGAPFESLGAPPDSGARQWKIRLHPWPSGSARSHFGETPAKNRRANRPQLADTVV